MVTEQQKKDEQDTWTAQAAAAEVSLKGLNLQDDNHVKGIYGALRVTDFATQTRLLEFIKDLQKEEPQQNGKMRCCFCILHLTALIVIRNYLTVLSPWFTQTRNF
jgi:hypothetical protein